MKKVLNPKMRLPSWVVPLYMVCFEDIFDSEKLSTLNTYIIN